MARNSSTSPPPTQGNGRPSTAFEADSTVGLLRRLGDDLSTLLRKELGLATAEISQAVEGAQKGLMSVATGGAVLFAGFLFLLLAGTAALAKVVEMWAAALIVGAIVAVVGYVMVSAGKKKLKPSTFKLDRTQDALREDAELLHRSSQ